MTKKRLTALLLVLAMCFTAVPFPAFAEGETPAAAASDTRWETSKSKTAEATDTEDVYDVTLSLPAAEEKLSSDIVFVLDKSSCNDATKAKAESLLTALSDAKENSQASIKVAVVSFRGAATNPAELKELDDAHKADVLDAINTKPAGAGTNIEAGLAMASDILENDKEVEDHRKYIILVSDGLTRSFLVDGQNSVIFGETGDGNYEGGVSSWSVARNKDDGNYSIPDGDWNAYWAKVQAWVEADGDEYVTVGVSTTDNSDINDQTIGDHPYVKKADWDDHALSVDRAFYNAWKLYTELDGKYNCYTQSVGSYAVGIAFLNMLGGEIDFTDIQNDILYLLDKGSTVEDYMGYDASQPYNFDFVDDAASLTLKIGSDTLSAEKLDAADGATSTYGFKPEALGGEYSYTLSYFKGDGKEEEHFVWTINEAVSNFAPVSLTYQVKLTEKSETPGEYEAFTNLSATLNPVDTQGNHGDPETFERPSVTYTVAEPETTPEETTPEETTPEETTPEETTAEETTAETTETEPETVPETGDDSRLLVWVCVSLTAIAAMTAVVIVSKKRSAQD